MTKPVLYVKICIMNTYLRRKTKFTIISILFALLLSCLCLAFCSPFIVKAENKSVSANNFLPQTELENVQLSSPIDVYTDGQITAITQSNQKLLINLNGEWKDNDISFVAIKQINRLDENNLIVSDNGTIYRIDISGNIDSKIPLSINSDIIGGNYFDINENYLITAFSNTGLIYKRENGGFVRYSDNTNNDFTVKDSSPIAINDDNTFYFVNEDGIFKFDIASNTYSTFIEGVSPTQIIANGDFVYYIANSSVYKVSASGGTPVELFVGAMDNDFDLGNVVNPTDISFKGENLLITSANSIQEFKVSDNQLIFTGFAIAKGKTAYNRVLATASKIEKSNKTIAVLDDFKLTIFTNNAENIYARENYKNYLVSSLIIDGVAPSNFALGDNSALLLYSDGNANEFLALLDFSKSQDFLSDKIIIDLDPNVRDICYQSGDYYILCDNGSAPQRIYKSIILDGQISFTRIDANQSTTEFTLIAVDVNKNIYLANNTDIAKLSSNDGYTQANVVSSLSGIKKIQTDLLGNIFVLTNGKVVCPNINAEYSIDNVKNFALDFVDDNVYFIKNNSEIIYLTTQLDNVSIADLIVPSEYTLTNPLGTFNANENLEFFSVPSTLNAYVVSTEDDKFIFEKFTAYTGEYVKICAVEYVNSYGFLVLANQNDIVLVDAQNVQTVQKQKITDDIPATAFVATNVHPYYLPIINPNGDFSFTSTDKIRLVKTTELNVKYKIEFLGCEYYYADFTYESNDYSAYIPCSYTVEVLNEDFAWDSYTIETVKETSVYSEADMQTVIANLSKNSQIRLIEKGEKVCKIAYKLDDGTYQIGYIYANKIIDNPSIAIRNVLIIILVFACVCGTLTYFILRKKRNN